MGLYYNRVTGEMEPPGGSSVRTHITRIVETPEPKSDEEPAVGSLIKLSRLGPLESRVITKHWLYTRNIIRPRRSWM